MNRLLVILFLILGSHVFAQTSEKYNSDYANFYRAEELYQKQQYSAARKEFRNFIDGFSNPTDPMYIKALYYEGVSALELYNNDAVDLLIRFNQNYPESIYKHDIQFRLGKYYYQKKDYEEALVWFNKLSVNDLEDEFREEFYFKLGYANFQEKRFEEARSAFYEIKDDSTMYSNPALYYYSHIEYNAGNYQTALDGFLRLEKDESFGKVVPYYILQIYYLQGKYEEVTDYAPNLENATVVNEKDVNHLIGDAYYRTGKYDEAVPYLQAYDKSAETTRDEDYQLGYALYKSKQFEPAIKLFDRVGKDKDSMGQVAFYHIGECYLELKNFASARAAFQQTSQIQANPKLEEDALYQFAVLSYKLDINPYNEAIIAFETYLEKYPSSKRKDDVYQYLINVYTSTNNYGKALESLDKLPNKDIRLRKAYQQIAYNHAIELYQKGEYQNAINTFGLVSKYPIDPSLNSKAVYWSADAQYNLKNFNKAIAGYKEFTSMSANVAYDLKNDAMYNLGYAYLYANDTTSAIENFRNYTNSNTTNKRKLADAHMRIADGYYTRKDNLNAIKFYDNALKINVANQDQALFYKGMTLGYQNQGSQKISALLDLINNYSKSKYVQDALYQVAFTYYLSKDYSASLKYFNQLLTDYPSTEYRSSSQLNIADIYFKKGEYAKAEQLYIQILDQTNDDDVCKSIGSGLQNIYTATKQTSKLEEVAAKYPCLGIDKLSLETALFSPAENDYESKNYARAIDGFKEYLEKYPTGYYQNKALLYTANSYYETKNMEQSMLYYEQFLTLPDNSNTEFAAIRASKYYYNNNLFQEAIPHYTHLEQITSNPEVKYNSILGLMRSYYQINDYTPAAAYAQQVISNPLVKSDERLIGNYILGMSSYQTQAYADAITALEYVSRNTTQAMSSESKFTIAQIYFDQGNMTDADATARAVLKMKPSYDYWIAKALILQAKISINKDDLFQAEQTLNSVLEYYGNKTDGIIAEAQALHDELMQLKNQPKSNIAPGGTTIIELNEGGN